MKITAENVNTIKEGDHIVKYPNGGEPKEEIDFNDECKITRWQVTKVTDKTVELALGIPAGTALGGLSVGAKPMSKSKTVMIEDNNWWKISS